MIELSAVVAHRAIQFDDRGRVAAHVAVGRVENRFRRCGQKAEHERRESDQHADEQLDQLHRLLRLVFLGQERPHDRADARARQQENEDEHRGLDFRHERASRDGVTGVDALSAGKRARSNEKRVWRTGEKLRAAPPGEATSGDKRHVGIVVPPAGIEPASSA